MKLMMTFAISGPWRAGRLTPKLPMALTLAPYGRFRLSPLERFSDVLGEPGSAPPILVEAQRTVQNVDRIVEAADVFGRSTLASPDVHELLEGTVRISAAIGFATGTALSTSAADFEALPNRYVADTTADRRLLDRFGVEHARLPLQASTGVEVADHNPVDQKLIEELARRGAVTVYCEALRTETNIGQFRELWRTLEFAFQSHGPRLVDLLVGFPPTAELGFDRSELEALRILRGRISHAASRSGTAEAAQTEGEVIEQSGRLWSLVDRVLLTKKDSSHSLDVDELRPLSAFIDRDGNVQFSAAISDPENWLEEHGSSIARRFRQPER